MNPTLPQPIQLSLVCYRPTAEEQLAAAVRRRNHLARQAEEARWHADVSQHAVLMQQQRINEMAATLKVPA